MPTVDPEQEKMLYKGLDILGAPTSLPLTGTSDIPAGATGLPAPSGVGGMSGFAGGAGVSGRPGMGGRPDEGLVALGKAVEGVKKLYGMQGPEPTRGDTGGQSLSDRLRSGEAAPGSSVAGGYGAMGADMLPLPGTQAQPTFNAQGIPVSGFGEVTPGAFGTTPDITITQQFGRAGNLLTPDQEVIQGLLEAGMTPDQIQAAFGEAAITQEGVGPAATLGTGTGSLSALEGLAAGGIGAIAGAIPGFITSQLTNDPLANTLASQAGAVGGIAAGGAVSGALGATAAGTGVGAGAAAGAGGALAAAAPAAMIAAPYLVAQLVKAWQGHADAGNIRELKNRVENIYGQLPGELQTLMKIPEIGSQLTEQSTPDQAASVLKQLNDIAGQYQTQGWEAYEKSGDTGVIGVGQDFGQKLPGVQQALEQATAQVFPMMDTTRMRAQDILQKAGWTPEQIQQQTGRYITPQEWALTFGSRTYQHDPETGSAIVPTREYNPWLAANYRPGVNVPIETPAGFGYEFQPASWSPEAQAAFAGLQPGGTEAGLRALFGGVQGANQFGWNPAFIGAPAAAQTMAAQRQGSLAGQINALLGGTGLEAGMLTEEERRRAGM